MAPIQVSQIKTLIVTQEGFERPIKVFHDKADQVIYLCSGNVVIRLDRNYLDDLIEALCINREEQEREWEDKKIDEARYVSLAERERWTQADGF